MYLSRARCAAANLLQRPRQSAGSGSGRGGLLSTSGVTTTPAATATTAVTAATAVLVLRLRPEGDRDVASRVSEP